MFAFALAASAAVAARCETVSVQGFEPIQSVQDDAGTIPLFSGKATLVRVFVSSDNTDAGASLSGTAEFQGGAGPPIPVASSITWPAVFDPNAQDVPHERNNPRGGIVFEVPTRLLQRGRVDMRILSLVVNGVSADCNNCAAISKTLVFHNTAPLALHIVAFQYVDPRSGVLLTPSSDDIAAVQSWIRRAYPVAEVQLKPYATFMWTAPPMTNGQFSNDMTACNDADAKLQRLRGQDEAPGSLVHYYAVVPAGSSTMVGCGYVPVSPVASATASGPNWKTGLYAGHEVGHTLGRQHINRCGAPLPWDQSDTNGLLGNDLHPFVGVDVGDRSLKPAQAAAFLPSNLTPDMMTYCFSQSPWISGETYLAICEQLNQERGQHCPVGGDQVAIAENLAAGPPVPAPQSMVLVGAARPQSSALSVTAVIDLKENSVLQITADNVLESNLEQRSSNTFGIVIRAQDAKGHILTEAPADISTSADQSPDGKQLAIAHALIQAYPSLIKIVLLRNGAVIGLIAAPPVVKPVRQQATLQLPNVGSILKSEGFMDFVVQPFSSKKWPSWGASITASKTEDSVKLSWVGQPSGRYSVALSRDGSWNTIGLDLTSPSVEFPASLLAGVKNAQVRITMQRGFAEHVIAICQIGLDKAFGSEATNCK